VVEFTPQKDRPDNFGAPNPTSEGFPPTGESTPPSAQNLQSQPLDLVKTEALVVHHSSAETAGSQQHQPSRSLNRLRKLAQQLNASPLVNRLAPSMSRWRSVISGKTLWLCAQNFPYLHALFFVSLGLTSAGAHVVHSSIRQLERSLPDTSLVRTYLRDGTVTIKASDGSTILRQVGPATHEETKIEQIPDRLLDAFIASEDRRFYQHDGIDYQGILRAITVNLQAREVVEGGSTITQQLTRIVFLSQERTFWRKLKEALLARKVEQDLSKEKILEKYLNLVYLGSGAYGVADASWVYFGKPLHELSLPDMALLAGMAPAPSDYSPLVNPRIATRRRNTVLRRMAEDGFITESQAEAAINAPLGLNPKIPKRLLLKAPYFTTYVQQELTKYVSAEDLEIGGLTVETTLDTKWQAKAEQVVRETIRQDGPSFGFGQAALVAIDPRSGEIKALVGGDDFNRSQFNRATQAQRQPGSTFKTFVYTTAIEAGFSPYASYLDAPYTIAGYQPENANRKYSGWISLRDALIYSINVVAVKLIVDVGFDPVIDTSRNMGIESELLPTYSLALGASEVNLLELTSAYGTLAAKGKHIKPHSIRRILNSRGEVIFDAKELKPKQAIDESTAAIMTWILQGVVTGGTGTPAQLADRPVAGKTGTSEEARDLWFIGYIPQLVVGVWLGNDDSSPTWGASTMAAYTWWRFVSQVTQGMAVQKFDSLPQIEGRKPKIKPQPVRGRGVTTGNPSGEGDRQNRWNTRPPADAPESPASGSSGNPAGSAPEPPPSSPSSGGSPSSPSTPEVPAPVEDTLPPPPSDPVPVAPPPPPPADVPPEGATGP